jgi:hypothetical protein
MRLIVSAPGRKPHQRSPHIRRAQHCRAQRSSFTQFRQKCRPSAQQRPLTSPTTRPSTRRNPTRTLRAHRATRTRLHRKATRSRRPTVARPSKREPGTGARALAHRNRIPCTLTTTRKRTCRRRRGSRSSSTHGRCMASCMGRLLDAGFIMGMRRWVRWWWRGGSRRILLIVSWVCGSTGSSLTVRRKCNSGRQCARRSDRSSSQDGRGEAGKIYGPRQPPCRGANHRR